MGTFFFVGIVERIQQCCYFTVHEEKQFEENLGEVAVVFSLFSSEQCWKTTNDEPCFLVFVVGATGQHRCH